MFVGFLIEYRKRPRNWENAEKGFVWEPRFHIPFWSMIYVLLKLKFKSKIDNVIEFELQCQINHGLEWNVEFSIPIPCRLLAEIFLIFLTSPFNDSDHGKTWPKFRFQ